MAALKVFEIRGIDRVDAAENHRLYHLEAGQRFCSRRAGARQRIADLDLGPRS